MLISNCVNIEYLLDNRHIRKLHIRFQSEIYIHIFKLLKSLVEMHDYHVLGFIESNKVTAIYAMLHICTNTYIHVLFL